MRLQRLRIGLYGATAVILAVSVGLLLWALLAPCVPRTATTEQVAGRSATSSPQGLSETPPLESFEPLFERRFRQPLYDPPPPEPPPVVKKKPPLPPIQLEATMIEASGNRAMFSSPREGMLVRGVGETIQAGETSVEIVEIAENEVVLRHAGELVTLKLNR